MPCLSVHRGKHQGARADAEKTLAEDEKEEENRLCKLKSKSGEYKLVMQIYANLCKFMQIRAVS